MRARRFVAAAFVSSVLAVGATAVTVGPAAAAPERTAATSSVTGWYCGYDNRTTPPTISYGAKGDTVREAQCLLISLGYSVGPYGIDGDFGSGTRSAVRAFQSDYHLGVDGIVGKNTWYGLRNY
ncbi:peptidoglycan-binding domain-containing protein [Streptomyces sp. NPDC001020]